jgi:hypothetical protein
MFKAGSLFDLILPVIRVVFEMSDICYIAYVTHFIAKMKQVTVKDIKSHGRSCMTEMSIAVNGGAADIKPDKWGMKGFKWFFLP